jgi:hypothetical protein
MGAPPLALVVSAVGLAKDQSKKYAIAGLAISGLTCCLWLFPLLGP